MEDVDAIRVRLEAALDESRVDKASTEARRLDALLGRASVVGRYDEDAYRKHLTATRRLTRELASSRRIADARALFEKLERSCQRCHDEYQGRGEKEGK